MLWINYVVRVNHFAECRKNRPMTVREMLINPKIPYCAMVREVEKTPYAGLNHNQKLSGSSD